MSDQSDQMKSEIQREIKTVNRGEAICTPNIWNWFWVWNVRIKCEYGMSLFIQSLRGFLCVCVCVSAWVFVQNPTGMQ